VTRVSIVNAGELRVDTTVTAIHTSRCPSRMHQHAEQVPLHVALDHPSIIIIIIITAGHIGLYSNVLCVFFLFLFPSFVVENIAG